MSYFKFRPVSNLEWLSDILINQRLFCSDIKSLNDPVEGFFHANIVAKGLVTLEAKDTTAKICSLSADMSDIRLWAHYAENHKGIAVEFSPDKPVKKVDYQKRLYTVHSGEYEKNAEFLIKLRSWKHEKEYRYITHDANEKYLYGTVKSIIFGIRTSETVKKLIKIFCEGNGIETHDTKLDTKAFKIKILKNL